MELNKGSSKGMKDQLQKVIEFPEVYNSKLST